MNRKNWAALPISKINEIICRQAGVSSSKLVYTGMTHFIAVRDLTAETEANKRWYEEYMFKARHFSEILRATDDDSVRKWYLVDSMMNYHEEWSNPSAASLRHNPFGATALYYTVGDNRIWSYLFNNDVQGMLSITNSIGKIHELKTGINIMHQQVGWFDNELPWVSMPFWDMYDKNPLRIAAYIQDRMDFKGIIARIGSSIIIRSIGNQVFG